MDRNTGASGSPRQIHQRAATRGHDLLRTRTGVGAEIIDQYHLARTQCGRQHLLQIRGKRQPINATRNDQGWTHPLSAQGGNRGRVDRRIARHRSHRTLPDWCPGVGRGQIQIAADFINHDDLAGIEVGLLECKQRACPPIAFTGNYGLFFRDQPRRRIARAMVQELSEVPWSSFHWAA